MYYLLETSITSNPLPLFNSSLSLFPLFNSSFLLSFFLYFLSSTPLFISSLAHHNFLLPLSPSTFLTPLLDPFLLLLLSIKTKQKFSLPYFKNKSNISSKRNNTKILLHCVFSSNIVKQNVTKFRSNRSQSQKLQSGNKFGLSCLDPELNPVKGDQGKEVHSQLNIDPEFQT